MPQSYPLKRMVSNTEVEQNGNLREKTPENDSDSSQMNNLIQCKENEQDDGGGVEECDPEPIIITPRTYFRRWIILALFSFYSMSNAYQWIHLNIIANILETYYNHSIPGDVDDKSRTIEWLSMIYMLAYIPLIFPSTYVLNRKGLRLIAIIGSFLNALGAIIKVFSVHPDRFAVLFLGQTTCAIAQVFILGIPARLAAVWFGRNEVSTATALGVFGNQIGVAIGFVVPPMIVPNEAERIGGGLQIMFYSGAAITTVLFILVLILFKKAPSIPPSPAQAVLLQAAKDENYGQSLRRLFSNPAFLILMLTYGLNTGSFYAISTLLNPIVLHYFPGQEENAGRIGLTLIVAGVLGSILAGFWLDKTKLFKYTTVGFYFLSFTGMLIFTFTLDLDKIWIVFLCGALLGFFMTGYLPVGFEFAAEITYPESEGTSSGLLNASAQTFGILLTLSMGELIRSIGIMAANLLVTATLLIGTIGTAMIRADLKRQRAGLGKLEALLQVDVR